ncbi:MAG: hypothetical protein R3B69_03735 [Candidatus Paceibacterota bacterium]
MGNGQVVDKQGQTRDIAKEQAISDRVGNAFGEANDPDVEAQSRAGDWLRVISQRRSATRRQTLLGC